MFSRFALALVAAALPLSLRAADPVLTTQKKLAQLGFYKGAADGQSGSQTSAAIRRYQIAENLKVTGELNCQTLRQLGIEEPAPGAPYVSLADIFRGGPYFSVGSDKQVAAVRQAQKNLKLLGYYSGPEDGIPNGGLVSALKVWQKNAGFQATGRIDGITLKGLDLIAN